ncbi:MAG: hypothetical protein OIF50_01925 [Flavobacteriaceae bacterium]|nr:hypothetical protein [Flavobacteriaceae bacterium]
MKSVENKSLKAEDALGTSFLVLYFFACNSYPFFINYFGKQLLRYGSDWYVLQSLMLLVSIEPTFYHKYYSIEPSPRRLSLQQVHPFLFLFK